MSESGIGKRLTVGLGLSGWSTCRMTFLWIRWWNWTANPSCLPAPLIQNERQPPSRKRPGPWRSHWPHHTQEGTAQVQAKADPYLQEQGPQAWTEGVRKQHPGIIRPGLKTRSLTFSSSSAASATTSLAWRVWVPTSQWSAHGRPSATWSSATWPNTASSKVTASCLHLLLLLLHLLHLLPSLPSLHLSLARRDKVAQPSP